MRKLKHDIDAGVPLWACGMDEAHLVPQPTINELLCASLGHRWPGVEEDLGLINFDLTSDEEVGFDPDRCGMCYETQFCNYLKFKYNVESLENKVFSQLPHIRKQGTKSDVLPAYRKVPLTTVPDPFQVSNVNAVMTPTPLAGNELTQADLDILLADYSDSGDDILQSLPKCIDRRNMANIGSSCFADVVIQLLSNVPEFKAVLQAGFEFRRLTGRSPTVLHGDTHGDKHMDMYRSLANLAEAVTISGERIPPQYCRQNLDAIKELTTSFPLGTGKENEASSFFDWIREILNTICDRSTHREEPDIYDTLPDGSLRRRHALTPSERLNNEHRLSRQRGSLTTNLQTNAQSHWEAFLKSGNLSYLSSVSTVQVVSLYHNCSQGCPAVQQDFSCSSSMKLRIGKAVKDPERDGTISLSTLIRCNLEESLTPQAEYNADVVSDLEQAQQCTHPDHRNAGAKPGELVRKVVSVTRAPKILIIDLQRYKFLESNPNPKDFKQQMLPEHELHLQRISNYHKLSVADLCRDASDLTFSGKVNIPHKAFMLTGMHGEYDITAIIAYSRRDRHFIVFIKREDDRWVCFNDLDKQPEYRDPVSQWPSGFVEHLLCYRKSGTDAGDEALPIKSSEVTAIEPIRPKSAVEQDRKQSEVTGDSDSNKPEMKAPEDSNKTHQSSSAIRQKRKKMQERIEAKTSDNTGENDGENTTIDVADLVLVKQIIAKYSSKAKQEFVTLLNSWYNQHHANDDNAITSGEETWLPRKPPGRLRRVSQDMLRRITGDNTTKIVASAVSQKPASNRGRISPYDSTGSQTETEGFIQRTKNRLSGNFVSPKKKQASGLIGGQQRVLQTPSTYSPTTSDAQQTPTRPRIPRPADPQSLKHRSQKRPSMGGIESEAKRSRTSLYRPDSSENLGEYVREERESEDPFYEQGIVPGSGARRTPPHKLQLGLAKSDEARDLSKPSLLLHQSHTRRTQSRIPSSWQTLTAVLSATDDEGTRKEKKVKKKDQEKNDRRERK